MPLLLIPVVLQRAVAMLLLRCDQTSRESNKALGCLLAMRSTIDVHWKKEVSDFGMALCQNESEVTEAIKTAKALCGHAIREVEAHHAVLISEARI